MPAQSPSTRPGLIALAGLATLALGAWATARSASTTEDEPKPPRWEYAVISIENKEPVLTTERVVQRVDVPLQPDDSTTVFTNSTGPFNKRFNRSLFQLNRLGDLGWEILPGQEFKDDARLLVRRRR